MSGSEVETLKAPFPWFGGKSRVAGVVWERFGDVINYVEPFAGSLAVLLGRPTVARTETINDKDCYVSNFWRALKSDPDGVTEFADGPVNEADLHARHLWLVKQTGFVERMKTNPDFYDVKVAGWWVWGLSQWIGGGWCKATRAKIPRLAAGGMGVTRTEYRRPTIMAGGMGVPRKRPILCRGRRGVGRHGLESHPHPSPLPEGEGGLLAYMESLASRLRHVRVVCGDFARILGPTPTFHIGTTAVFLDPPYPGHAGRKKDLYATECLEVSDRAQAWAVDYGDDERLRIAFCGYEGTYEWPEGWVEVAWKASGGYGSQSDGRGRVNAGRERIWFSRGCLTPGDGPLFRTSFLEKKGVTDPI